MTKKFNKNKFLGLVLLFSLFLGIFFSVQVRADSATACNLNVSLVNQDPYPAIPDSYVKLTFQVTGVQNSECDGAYFALVPTYPFSLEENPGWIILNDETYILGSEYKSSWMIPYTVRVDKDALDDSAEIEVHYSSGKGDPTKSESYLIQKFNISIQDSRTAFDAVIQESTGTDVSIAIANIGKYTANSVVVRIPEQDDFAASGTDGQMVGNLDSGDYTIVGFTVSQKMTVPNRTAGGIPDFQSQTKKLAFDIYYTDNIGERRIVSMALPLNTGNSSMTSMGAFPGRMNQKKSSWYSSWVLWVIILGVILIGVYAAFKKHPKKTKELLHRINLFKKKEYPNISSDNKIPDWIRNAKKKER